MIEKRTVKCRHDRWEIVRLFTKEAERLVKRNGGVAVGGSFDNILHSVPDSTRVDVDTLLRELSLEFGSDVTDLLGRKLHKSFQIRASAEGSEYIDVSDIVLVYKATIIAPSSFYNPKGVFLKLLKDFEVLPDKSQSGIDDVASILKPQWMISDIIRVASVAAETEDDMECTAWVIKHWFRNHLKTTFSKLVHMGQLEELFQSLPELIQSFNSQMRAKLSSTQRLKLIAGEEDASLREFLMQSKKIGTKRMTAFKKRRLQKLFFVWRQESQLATRLEHQRRKKALMTWYEESQHLRMNQLLDTISCVKFYESKMRKCFRKWNFHLSLMKKVGVISCTSTIPSLHLSSQTPDSFSGFITICKIRRSCISDAEKKRRFGIGYLRTCWNKAMRRKAFEEWKYQYTISKKGSLAKKWRNAKILTRSFLNFRIFARKGKTTRTNDRRACIQLKALGTFLNEIDSDLKRIAHEKECAERQRTLMAKKERARRYEEARLRRGKREERRARVKHEKILIEDKIRTKWLRKKAQAESDCLNSRKTRMNSSEYNTHIAKKENEIRRFLSLINDSSVNEDQEKALVSPGVISYSLLDGKFAVLGVVPDEIFDFLRKDVVLVTAERFKSALVSCEVHDESCNDLFADITGSKKNGYITIEDLYELRRQANSYIGEEGTLWKMYESPVHQQLVFHNVSSNEKIADDHLNKKQIRRIVRENIEACEILRARRKCYFEKKEAHKLMMEDYASTSIQSMYHQWKGRRTLKSQKWVLERLNLFQCRKDQAHAASVIQRALRKHWGDSKKF
ncbi:hypothetical protein ACHAXS_003372 [Conticribra weissflogii]